MKKLEIFNFEDKEPKRGKIVCFSEESAAASFYFLDGRGDAWGKTLGSDDWEYAGLAEDLQGYGTYSHWARIGDVFNINFDIPKD